MYDSHNEIHPALTFDEASIITFNINGSKEAPFLSLEEFLLRMDTLYHNTTDPYLRRAVQSIQDKISKLTVPEYDQLCRDCADGKLIFPANYMPPSINHYE